MNDIRITVEAESIEKMLEYLEKATEIDWEKILLNDPTPVISAVVEDSKKCTCSHQTVMWHGCKCGGE